MVISRWKQNQNWKNNGSGNDVRNEAEELIKLSESEQAKHSNENWVSKFPMPN